jgi:2-polyprenyl-6-methoxyphenol hydroxylase-like FAD-dependent oxidoreductase
VEIAIVGAGIGGLCLAQGLRQAGLDVTVYERDPSPESRGQGYRLHIDANGAGALRECMPRELYERYVQTSYRPETDTPRITVLTKRLRTLRVVPLPVPEDSSPATGAVDRQVLREVLYSRLDERLRFGWEFTGFTSTDLGAPIRLHFADGREGVADVLVGADGVGSRVRSQYLPDAVVHDTGARCVYGRTPPNAVSLPEATRHGFVAIVDIARSRGMAIGVMRFPQAFPAEDYVMWALTAPKRAIDDTPRSGPELTELATRLIRRWHPDLRQLVVHCDAERTAVVPIRVAQPVPAWATTGVTLLGDAIHAMSPSGGSGANTALRDAAMLSRALASPDGESALHRYEAAMLEYGFAAVARSQPRGLLPWRRS